MDASDTIADDKNAYRKVQRMLEYQTHLDSIVTFATEPLVDEELEAEIEGGYYSKRNVDRRAKRQKAKTAKLQQKLKQQSRQVKGVTE